MSGHPVLPAKYSTDCSFKLSKLAQIVSVGAGFRPQKGQRDNFIREPPCLQQSILGDPACMKSREDQTRALLTLRIHACTISLTEMSIPCNLTSILFLFIYFFSEEGGGEREGEGGGRLRIGEPEHLRMRGRNVCTRKKNAVPPDTGAGASYQTSHPGISARAIAFGRSWPFTAFCYRPCLPVRH